MNVDSMIFYTARMHTYNTSALICPLSGFRVTVREQVCTGACRQIMAMTLRNESRWMRTVLAKWADATARSSKVRRMIATAFKSKMQVRLSSWREFTKTQKRVKIVGVILFQALYRGYAVRIPVIRHNAAIVVQKFARMVVAMSFTSAWRRRRARNRLVAKKYARKLLMRYCLKAIRQWKWRTRLHRKVRGKFLAQMRSEKARRFHRWVEYLDVWFQEQTKAATTIQCLFRGYWSKIVAYDTRGMRNAVLNIQRVYRGKRSRLHQAWLEDASRAVLRIAARWRGRRLFWAMLF